LDITLYWFYKTYLTRNYCEPETKANQKLKNNIVNKKTTSSDELYRAPKSQVLEDSRKAKEKQAIKKIRSGWIAAIAYGTLTLVLLINTESQATLETLFDYSGLFEVLFIYLLAFGIYLKSRVSATLMLVFFIASKLFAIAVSGKYTGIGIIIIFSYFYFHAMVATYQYQSMKSRLEIDSR